MFHVSISSLLFVSVSLRRVLSPALRGRREVILGAARAGPTHLLRHRLRFIAPAVRTVVIMSLLLLFAVALLDVEELEFVFHLRALLFLFLFGQELLLMLNALLFD